MKCTLTVIKLLWTTLFTFISFVSVAQSISNQSFTDSARNTLNLLTAEQRFTKYLNTNELSSLPIGMQSNAGVDGNALVTIAVGKVDFKATYAEITVFARLHIPQENKTLDFGARGIRLSYKGGLIGDAKLSLLSDVEIPMGASKVTLKGGDFRTNEPNLTYLSIDCDGFRELSIVADVELPDTFHPIDASGEPRTGKVIGHFKTVVSGWNDILAEVTLPSFGIKGLTDFGFDIRHAVIDLSDLRNSSNAIFPPSYTTGRHAGSDGPLWRGIYINELYVSLPKQFKNRNRPERVGFEASNLLIDDNGVSGSFYGDNVLSLEQGSASGWRFSVNSFRIDLETNRLIGAGFQGQIGLPGSKQQAFDYKALISANNEYLLQVATTEVIDFDIWKAKLRIDESSYAELKVVDGQFRPSVLLNGYMSINAGNGENSADSDEVNKLANIPDIVFQELKISTEAPYLSVAYMGYQGTASIKGFPISISDIKLKSTGEDFGLGFSVNLDLSEKLIQGSTTLTILGSLRKDKEEFHMAYKGADLARIQLNSTIGGQLRLSGGIDIFDKHPVYGDGFGGDIKIGVDAIKLKDISARIKFGRSTFRYWYVDAIADFGDVGVTIPPALTIRGFSGAAYNRMVKAPTYSAFNPTKMDYLPEEKAGFGIRFGLLIHVAKKEVCDIEASFETSFNRHGGVNYIGIYGSASLLGAIPGIGDVKEFVNKKASAVNDKVKSLGINDEKALALFEETAVSDPRGMAELLAAGPNTQTPGAAGLHAELGILFDFNNKAFQANFDLYVNYLGGIIKGVGADSRAGYAVMRFAPEEWYIYAGTPDDPMGLQMGIGVFRVKTQSYMMIGSKILGSPAPPQQVADILGKDLAQLEYMRDLNALERGAGFAFGSHLSMSTGEFRFLILYASLEAGVGFDIMLKNYGIQAHCEGNDSPIGINGWYANGQAYAYLQGEIGLRVKLFRKVRRFSLLKAGAAVLMQAKLPNPAWFKGHMAVKYRVLGGLIKGNINLGITLGKECKIIGAGLDQEMPIIASISPEDNDQQVDVFTAPQVAFNIPIDKEMAIEEDGNTKVFRIKFEEFSLKAGNRHIDGKLEWNTDRNLLSILSKEVLPPNEEISATVRVSMEEQVNGQWRAAYENGQRVEETKSIRFQTGDAPYFIPMHNIEFMYPVKDQQNYYPNESTKGLVQLKRGQQYLFTNPDAIALVLDNKGKKTSLPVQYDRANTRLNFAIPELVKSASYEVQLINKQPDPNQMNSGKTSNYKKETDADGNTMEVQNTQANAQQRDDLQQVYLDYAFNSSHYATLAKKLDAIKNKESLFWIIGTDLIDLQIQTSSYEPFDIVELQGTEYSGRQPLIAVEADVAGEKYYNQYIYPLIYENYPLDPAITISHRALEEYGLVPLKGMRLSNSVLSDLASGKVSGYHTNYLPWVYNLPFHYKMDFLDLQNKAVNRYLGKPEAIRFERLIQGTFPFILKGKYKTNYQYRLPGGLGGSTTKIQYENRINSTTTN